MGSRKTNEDRIAQLRDLGLSDEDLARLYSPLGLDIGARTPEETAVSIGAEIIKARWGGTGQSLGETEGPIHPKLWARGSGDPFGLGRERGVGV